MGEEEKKEKLDNVSKTIQTEQNKIKKDFTDEKINEIVEKMKDMLDKDIEVFVEQQLIQAEQGTLVMKEIQDDLIRKFSRDPKIEDHFNKHTNNQRWTIITGILAFLYIISLFGVVNASWDMFLHNLLLIFVSSFYIIPYTYDFSKMQQKNPYIYCTLMIFVFYLFINIAQRAFAVFDIFKEHQTDLWNDNLQDEDLYLRQWWQVWGLDLSEYKTELTCEELDEYKTCELVEKPGQMYGTVTEEVCTPGYKYGEREAKLCKKRDEELAAKAEKDICTSQPNSTACYMSWISKFLYEKVFGRSDILYLKPKDFAWYSTYITTPSQAVNFVLSRIPLRLISGFALFSAGKIKHNNKDDNKDDNKKQIKHNNIDITKVIICEDTVLREYVMDVDNEYHDNEYDDNDDDDDISEDEEEKKEKLDNVSKTIQTEQNKIKKDFTDEKINEIVEKMKDMLYKDIEVFVEQQLIQ